MTPELVAAIGDAVRSSLVAVAAARAAHGLSTDLTDPGACDEAARNTAQIVIATLYLNGAE